MKYVMKLINEEEGKMYMLLQRRSGTNQCHTQKMQSNNRDKPKTLVFCIHAHSKKGKILEFSKSSIFNCLKICLCADERLNVHVNKALNYVDVQGLMAQTD